MLNISKTYYSISEVCRKTGLEPHVLRYWETEFPQLRPKKNRAGNRAYREKDIELISYIKYLLYTDKFTIPGAKKKLADMKEFDIPVAEEGTSAANQPLITVPPVNGYLQPTIKSIADELRSVLTLIKR